MKIKLITIQILKHVGGFVIMCLESHSTGYRNNLANEDSSASSLPPPLFSSLLEKQS